jgi:hypothetical protein
MELYGEGPMVAKIDTKLKMLQKPGNPVRAMIALDIGGPI